MNIHVHVSKTARRIEHILLEMPCVIDQLNASGARGSRFVNELATELHDTAHALTEHDNAALDSIAETLDLVSDTLDCAAWCGYNRAGQFQSLLYVAERMLAQCVSDLDNAFDVAFEHDFNDIAELFNTDKTSTKG